MPDSTLEYLVDNKDIKDIALFLQLFLMCYIDIIEYQIAFELGSQTSECEDLTILWR